MRRPTLQVSLTASLLLVALAALNFWLFRVGVLAGLIGLGVTKHVLIAALCQHLGVGKGAHAGPAEAGGRARFHLPTANRSG